MPLVSTTRPPSLHRSLLIAELCAVVCLALFGCRQKARENTSDAAAVISQAASASPDTPPAVAVPSAFVLPAPSSEAPRHPRGGLDVTFLVAADPHFGAGRPIDDDSPIDRRAPVGVELIHDQAIRQMKALHTRPWPAGLGQSVARPLGLIMAGDLTDDGSLTQWNRFLAWYGERSDDLNLGIPLLETIGNHDRIRGDVIVREVQRRHGSESYSWNWGDLHVAVLGEAPDDRSLAWLEQDLLRTGPWVPVVVVLHYALAGPYSVDEWRRDGGPYERFRTMLQGYRVVGIFHGHYHAAGSYLWKGLDVYRVGSAKYVHHSFAVVHVTDSRMVVALWNTDSRAWWWWHTKRIDREGDRGMIQVVPLRGVDPPEIER